MKAVTPHETKRRNSYADIDHHLEGSCAIDARARICRRFLAMVLVSAGLLTGAASAGSDPFEPSFAHEFGKALANGVAAAQNYAVQKRDFNAQIAQARKEYWSAYPDGPGFREAEKRFMELLGAKDLVYIIPCLTNGPSDGLKRMWAFNMIGGMSELDGGVRHLAENALREMAGRIRRSAGLKGDPGIEEDSGRPPPLNQLLMIPSTRATKAIEANTDAIKAYIEARNRAEMLKGLDYIRFHSDREYLATLVFLEGNLNSVEEAEKILQELDRALGATRVSAAAAVIRKLPKDPEGRLKGIFNVDSFGGKTDARECAVKLMRAGMDQMPFDSDRQYLAARLYLDGEFDSVQKATNYLREIESVLGAKPVDAVAADIRRRPKQANGDWALWGVKLDLLVGRGDARSYAVGLIRDDRRISWTEAAQVLKKYWIEPFGEKVVLAAAEKVRLAPKEVPHGKELVQEIKGTDRAAEAMRRLMPSDPYRDYPLGSLTDKDPRRYLYAVLRAWGGVPAWKEVPAAYDALLEKCGRRRVDEATAKLLSARKNQDGTLAAPAEVSVSSSNPWKAFNELLRPSQGPPRAYFAALFDNRSYDGRLEYDMLALCFGKDHLNEVINQVREAEKNKADLASLEGAVSGFDTPAQAILDILWATAPPENYLHYLIWRDKAPDYAVRGLEGEERVKEALEEKFKSVGRQIACQAAAKIARAKKSPFTIQEYNRRSSCPHLADPASVGLKPPLKDYQTTVSASYHHLEGQLLKRARVEAGSSASRSAKPKGGNFAVGQELLIDERGKWLKGKILEFTQLPNDAGGRYLIHIGGTPNWYPGAWYVEDWLREHSRPVSTGASAGDAAVAGAEPQQSPDSVQSTPTGAASVSATSSASIPATLPPEQRSEIVAGDTVQAKEPDTGEWRTGVVLMRRPGGSFVVELWDGEASREWRRSGQRTVTVKPDELKKTEPMADMYPQGTVLRVDFGEAERDAWVAKVRPLPILNLSRWVLAWHDESGREESKEVSFQWLRDHVRPAKPTEAGQAPQQSPSSVQLTPADDAAKKEKSAQQQHDSEDHEKRIKELREAKEALAPYVPDLHRISSQIALSEKTVNGLKRQVEKRKKEIARLDGLIAEGGQAASRYQRRRNSNANQLASLQKRFERQSANLASLTRERDALVARIKKEQEPALRLIFARDDASLGGDYRWLKKALPETL